MPRRKDQPRDYARRGVYVDYLHRFAWTVDSLGHEGRHFPIHDADDDEEALKASLWAQLDTLDPIPSGAFVPAPLGSRDRSHLRLL